MSEPLSEAEIIQIEVDNHPESTVGRLLAEWRERGAIIAALGLEKENWQKAHKELVDEIKSKERRIAELQKLLDRDHTGLAAGLNAVLKVAKGYGWIPAGEWGSYEWDERTEKTFRAEVGRCFEEMDRIAQTALRESGTRAGAAFVPEKDQLAALSAWADRVQQLAATVQVYPALRTVLQERPKP